METVQTELLRQGEKPERKLFLDIARILAVLGVIMIHASGDFANLYAYNNNFSAYIVGNIFSGISRIGVPIFLMISGALMLDESKQVTWGYIIKKIKSIAVLLIFWSACYSLFFSVIWPAHIEETVSVKETIKNFLLGHYHLWYLYMIMGMYLITPFLRAFVKKGNEKMVLLFILIAVVAQFFIELVAVFADYSEWIQLIADFIGKFRLNFFSGFVVYYLVGWYIVHIGVSKNQKIILCCLSICSVVGIVLLGQFMPEKSGWGHSDTGLLVLLYTTGLFALLSGIKNNSIPQKWRRVVVTLSNLTLGVYIVHAFVLWLVRLLLSFITNTFLSIMVLWVISTLLSFAICYVISKIPYAKKLIRG